MSGRSARLRFGVVPVDAPEPLLDQEAAGEAPPVRRSRRPWSRMRAPSVTEVPFLVAFAVAAWRNKWIADDGYIYLTYVRRTLDGQGPVFNQGEHVEAFTSPGWFAILTAIRFVVRIGSLETLVLLLGLLLSFVAVAMLTVGERRAAVLRRRTSSSESLAASGRGRWAAPVLNLPLALAAGTYVFASFATSGLETPLLLVWCSAVALAAWAPVPRPWVLAGLGAVAPLVRPDLGLLAIVLALIAWRSAPLGRRRWVPVVVAAPLALSVAVRIAIYGQLVPNTFYAKTDTGHGWSDGVAYLRDAAMPYALQWLAVLALVAALARPVQRWAAGTRPRAVLDPASRRSLLLAGAAVVTGMQVMLVGGDFMHGRFWIVPWWFLLCSLAGVGTTWLTSRPTARWRSLVVALAAATLVFGVQTWSTSMQRLYAGDAFFGIGDVTDEQAYYESTNPEVHALVPDNQSPLFRLGRSLSAASAELDQELGVSVGAIGQVSYGGATGDGEVFVYDLVGLTQPDVSRLAVVGDPRVGHARVAPDVMAALHHRVDFHAPYFEGYADAFTVHIDDMPLVLVDLDLVDDLRRAGIVDDAAVAGMDAYVDRALAGPTVDANFLTFLRERVHEDDEVLARLDELADVERSSSWRRWLERHADRRSVLSVDGCPDRNWFECVGLAIDRHRAGPIDLDIVQPDARQVGTVTQN